jgi:hypothetical protein
MYRPNSFRLKQEKIISWQIPAFQSLKLTQASTFDSVNLFRIHGQNAIESSMPPTTRPNSPSACLMSFGDGA